MPSTPLARTASCRASQCRCIYTNRWPQSEATVVEAFTKNLAARSFWSDIIGHHSSGGAIGLQNNVYSFIHCLPRDTRKLQTNTYHEGHRPSSSSFVLCHFGLWIERRRPSGCQIDPIGWIRQEIACLGTTRRHSRQPSEHCGTFVLVSHGLHVMLVYEEAYASWPCCCPFFVDVRHILFAFGKVAKGFRPRVGFRKRFFAPMPLDGI
jgi:hypothetical protein